MSDEYDNESPSFSIFWPLLILLVGLLIWIAGQDYTQNKVRATYNDQFEKAIPTIKAAEGVQAKYFALIKDLIQTGQKDQAAATIVKDAIQAGLIRVQQQETTTPAADATGTNATATPAAPGK